MNPAPPARFTQQQGQQSDYSPRGLFMQQHGDFMNDMERYEPMITLRGSLMANQHIGGEPGSFDLYGSAADVNLPYMISSDGYLTFGGYYEGRRYKFSTATGLNDEYLLAGGLVLGIGGFLDDNWLVEFEARLGVYSDVDGGLTHKDYDFPSHLLFTWRTVEHFYLKFGARYNQVYEDAPWLPYLGFGWNISGSSPTSGGTGNASTWRVDVLLPEKAEVSFWPSANTGLLLGTEIRGAEYHVRTSAATGHQSEDVHVQEVITYLGAQFRMSEMFSVGARGGAVLAGDYHLTNGFGGFNTVDGSLGQALFAEISMGFDF